MKTKQEIQAEARDIIMLAGQFLNARSANTTPASADNSMRFQFPTNLSPGATQRHVEATMLGGALVFRLIERQNNSHEPKRDQEADGILLASSPSAYEVLSAGYEMAEEERLAKDLEPYAERSEETVDPADRETVSSVEAILGSSRLSSSDRIRTKAEIVEFLEGRLEPNELISRTIERQCARETIATRNELKLTIGEP